MLYSNNLVNPIGALFRPFGFGCFNLFIYLYIVLRRRTIYLCGAVQFHNANIHDISIISNFYNRIFDYFLIENYGEGVINYE